MTTENNPVIYFISQCSRFVLACLSLALIICMAIFLLKVFLILSLIAVITLTIYRIIRAVLPKPSPPKDTYQGNHRGRTFDQNEF